MTVRAFSNLVFAWANEVLPSMGVCVSTQGQHPCPVEPTAGEIFAWHLVTAVLVLVAALHNWLYWRNWPTGGTA